MRKSARQHAQPTFDSGGASARCDAFINEMKALQLYPGVNWNDMVWKVTGSAKAIRGHLAHESRFVFADHGSPRSRNGRTAISKRMSLAPAFADLVKAAIVRRYADRGMGPGPQIVFLRAARYVYGALPLPARHDPTLISGGHFVAAEAAVLEREAPSSAYRISVGLDEFARILDRRGLCRAQINFHASTPRSADETERTTAEFAKRMERLPSKTLIEGLADLANDKRIAAEPFDLLRIRLVELLLIGGFRIGELLTLPADPLIREPVLDEGGVQKLDAETHDPLERLGIRYWAEKGGDPIPKWIPTIANPFVLRAIEDIDVICRAARENALWLEQHPGEVNVAIGDDDILTAAQAARLLGLHENDGTQFLQWIRGKERGGDARLFRRGHVAFITGANLKLAMATDRYDKPMLTKDNGSRQSLGESFIVSFQNAGHRDRATNYFISVPLTWGQIAEFLGGRSNVVPSVFDRFGIADDSGQICSATSHDFRRLLNTIAQRGGLTQAEIALWMGRRRVKDNAAYDLRGAAEMAAEMRQLVEGNEVYGTISDQVRALPETEREAFLNDRLTMIHTTQLGHCASNIAENPCATAVTCLGGCGHYLRRKGDTKSRVALERIEQDTVNALERTKALVGKGNAANWVRGHETVLKNARAALAIDDDPNVASGQLRHVNPGGPVLGRPL